MWKKFIINKKYIIETNDRSVRIACPTGSKYSGYSFAFPAKLVRQEGETISLLYSSDFIFRLQCWRKTKFNNVWSPEEVQIIGSEIETVFKRR